MKNNNQINIQKSTTTFRSKREESNPFVMVVNKFNGRIK